MTSAQLSSHESIKTYNIIILCTFQCLPFIFHFLLSEISHNKYILCPVRHPLLLTFFFPTEVSYNKNKLHGSCVTFLTQTQTPISILHWEVSDVGHSLPFPVHLLTVSFSLSVLVNLHDTMSFHNQSDAPKYRKEAFLCI